MSAKKSETQIPKELNPDSGYMSGPIDICMPDSVDLSDFHIPIQESDNDKQVSSDNVRKNESDSGVVVLSDMLSDVSLTESPSARVVVPSDTRPSLTVDDIPPVALLFQQDEEGDTSLHVSAAHGCEKSIRTLIRVCPNKEWLNIPNCCGLTALHIAVMVKNSKITRMLVIAGASLAVRDNRGETPLHKATIQRDVKCIQALLTPVSEHPQRKLSSVLEQKNYNGQTCVHLAASGGHVDTLHTLVYYGCDINSTENLAGWTALHIAAACGDTAMCRYIVRHSAAAASARDCAGRTPRSYARHNAAADVIPLLEDDDYESEVDDDDSESEEDAESLFERLRETNNLINVA